MRYTRKSGPDSSNGSNPVLNEQVFERVDLAASSEDRMTVAGTVMKTVLLLVLMLPTVILGWLFPNPILLIVSLVVGLGLGFATAFVPRLARVFSVLYVVAEGYFVGFLSITATVELKDTQYAAAVPIATSATLLTLAVMLGLYASRIIKVTDTLIGVITGATIATGLFYLFSLLVSLFLPGFASSLAVHQSGPVGIIFSVFVIAVAAANFLKDFHFIETGVQAGAPKSMEWYSAFGLMVTIIWLYIEFLRLLMKLGGRR